MSAPPVSGLLRGLLDDHSKNSLEVCCCYCIAVRQLCIQLLCLTRLRYMPAQTSSSGIAQSWVAMMPHQPDIVEG